MIIELSALDATGVLETDICVIGSGAAGLSLAAEFFDTGDRVLVLENGRRVPLRTVMHGAIVDNRPGGPLLAAWRASRTPADQRETAERAELVRRGVNPDRLP